jgi:hypothetical protein
MKIIITTITIIKIKIIIKMTIIITINRTLIMSI